MRLADYLKSREIKQMQFARKVGISVSMVHFLCEGKRKPSLDLARKITEATNHEVTFADLCATSPAGDAA